MLHEWLNRPHIVEWWGGEEARPSLEEVKEQYLPSAMAEASVIPYIAMLGAEPIGFAQSYLALGSGGGWWEDETDPGVLGIDQSLANPDQLGMGLGTKLVRALVKVKRKDENLVSMGRVAFPTHIKSSSAASSEGSDSLADAQRSHKHKYPYRYADRPTCGVR
jgi:GNAT superfamily N-acetyltransferase